MKSGQCTPLKSRGGEEGTLKEIIFEAVLTILLAALLVSSFTAEAHATESVVYLCISPYVCVAGEIGEVFELSVDIVNVQNLHSVGFTLAYNTSLLDVAQVAQGSFFPPPPGSRFELENDDHLGLIKVNISVAGSEPPLDGTGTLVTASFQVVQSSEGCSGSPLNLQQTLLLDAALVPIVHESVGAVYFWRSMQPDPPVGGRSLDLYTQNRGIGPDSPGGIFVINQEVHLFSYVTYNGYPVQQKLVGFEVFNPANETVLFRTAVTNENGLANMSFRIPFINGSIGTWRAISVVEIAEEVVWDTISFEVLSELPVGGYSIRIPTRNTVQPAGTYTALICLFGAVVAVLRRKRK